jgi:hypothetical protein
MGEPTRSGVALTLALLLLGAALTLVLAHTAQSEMTMMVARAILMVLRESFMAMITLFCNRSFKHVKLSFYGLYLRIKSARRRFA